MAEEASANISITVVALVALAAFIMNRTEKSLVCGKNAIV